MSAWDDLPNAEHITRVIASVKENPHVWANAYNGIKKNNQYFSASGTSHDSVRDAARRAVQSANRGKTYFSAWDAVRGAAGDPEWGTMRGASRDAVLALIAYDDCAYMLDSDPGELAILVAFGDEKAILLQVACIVFSKEKDSK